MKRLLNTLYITTQHCWLAKDGECVSVCRDDQPDVKIPLHTLQGLVLFGVVTCSPFLLGHCAEKNIAVSWLTNNGRFLGALRGSVSGNVLLRREQYRHADQPQQSAMLARAFVIGKIVNCRTVLLRAAREKEQDCLTSVCAHLADCLTRLTDDVSLEQVRGIEGEAARAYFSVFNALICSEDSFFHFGGRSRRPPLDAVNCLLSFFYTLLMHDIRSALECYGLDPAVGFLHRDRPGRPSLALDMMEEFRPYLADRLACTMINRGQIQKKDFRITESGAVLLTDDARKKLIHAWQERKQTDVNHPFLQEKMPVGLLFHSQAQLLARYLRGDGNAYPPFVIR